MSKSGRIFVFVLTLALLGGVLWVTSSGPSGALRVNQAKRDSARLQENILGQGSKSQFSEIEAWIDPVDQDSPEVFTEARIQTISRIADQYFKLNKHWKKQQLRKVVLDRLIQQPRYLEVASQALTHPGFLDRNFAENQAEFRVFSIRLLEHAARNGRPESLIATLSLLQKSLNENGELKNGQTLDYADLLYAYISNYSGDQSGQSVDQMMKKIGVRPILLSSHVGRTQKESDIINAFFSALKTKFAEDQVVKFTQTYFLEE